MNRELQQVRRYWPRAKRSKSGARLWAAGKRVNLTLVADVWEVDFASDAPLPALKHIGATIPEAMRAAGFGVRPMGKFAFRRGWHELRRDIQIAMGFSPRVSSENHTRLQSTQRHRKGARFGRRKRTGWDKEETRHFAQWRELEGRP